MSTAHPAGVPGTSDAASGLPGTSDTELRGTTAIGADQLRVALLHPCYWPEVRRGAERLARELATGLLGRGHRVRLITSHKHLPSRVVEGGLEVLRLWRPPTGRLRRRGYEDYLTHLPLSYAAIRAGEDDVLHALAAPEAVVAARAGQRSQARTVFTYMGVPSRWWLVQRRMRLQLMDDACRQCHAVVALSHAAADEFWTVLGARAHVIHPSVDTEVFTPGGSRSEIPTIFCAAPLEVAWKRVSMLIQALPHVRRTRPGTQLVLLETQNPRLMEQVRRDHQGVQFVDPGAVAERLTELYRSAWVSALPSRGEAFGLVLAESLACGTPVVGTENGGIPDVIDRPDVGRLFTGDEQELARALLDTLELSEQSETSAACRARAELLSTRRAAAAYEELYESLPARRG